MRNALESSSTRAAARHLVLHQVRAHRTGRPPLPALAVHVHGQTIAEVAPQLVSSLVQHGQRHGAVVIAREHGALFEAAAAAGEGLEVLLLP